MKAITPFIIIAICVGAYFLYISPALGEVDILKAKRMEYTNILEKANELKEERDKALAAYNNISEDDLARLNKIIPHQFDPVLFANDLNALASRYGMTIKNLKADTLKPETSETTDAPVESPLYRTTTVSFKLTGQYEQFIKFLQDIESSLQLIDVTSLSIKPIGGEKSTEDFLDYSLEVNTYALQ